jgi:hypothetical protein
MAVGTSDLPELLGAEEAFSILCEAELSQLANGNGMQSVVLSPK